MNSKSRRVSRRRDGWRRESRRPRCSRGRSRARGRERGEKFRIDLRPVDLTWRAIDDDDDARSRFRVRWSRGAKVQRTTTATATAGRANWETTSDDGGWTTAVVTLRRRAARDGGTTFEAKAFDVKAERARGDGDGEDDAFATTAKASVDFARFATVETGGGLGGEEACVMTLTVKDGARGVGGAKTMTLRCRIRATWLKNYANASADGATELSMVSGLESESSAVTDATPPNLLREQDLSGFQQLLSPVAESVSPVIVRQSERREEQARAELEAQRRLNVDMEVRLEAVRNELEKTKEELATQRRAVENESARAQSEIAAAKEEAQKTLREKERAIDRVLSDIAAIEKERNAAVRASKDQGFHIEALERSLRERDSDIARLKSLKDTDEATATLEAERIAHSREIERYKSQLDAADTQIETLSRSHKNAHAAFQRKLDSQLKLRAEAEKVFERELEQKHVECDDLRQQCSNIVAETTALTTALKRSADEQHRASTNTAKAEAAQAKCDLRAVSEELCDVRKVLDAHVIELVEAKLNLAESQGSQLVLRRELARTKGKLTEYAARCTRMESMYATIIDESTGTTET